MRGLFHTKETHGLGLHAGQRMAVDFAVKVEGVDVGHAREEVEHGHEACAEPGGVHLVLRGDLREEE